MLRRAGLIALTLLLLLTSAVSAATATVKVVNYGFSPKALTVTLGNSVKWKNTSTKTHTATPTNNWSWGGVTVAAGTTSTTVTPTQAGTFPYFCSIHPTLMKGKLKVAMTVSPLAGNTGTSFTLTLGTVQAPGVLVHQIEVRQNGGAWVLRATTAAPTISISFPTTGNWDIHTRLRYQLGGATSGWTPIVSIVVF
jgi:plastocyanin